MSRSGGPTAEKTSGILSHRQSARPIPAQFAPYRRRLLLTATLGVPLMVVGPLLCFAAGSGLAPCTLLGAAGVGVFAWGFVGFNSVGARGSA